MVAVIAKDVDMPKSCGACEYYGCDEYKSRNWGAPPPENCPLVSIDGLVEEIKKKSLGLWYVGRADGRSEEVALVEDVIRTVWEYCGDVASYGQVKES